MRRRARSGSPAVTGGERSEPGSRSTAHLLAIVCIVRTTRVDRTYSTCSGNRHRSR